jgi:hypothetical protein
MSVRPTDEHATASGRTELEDQIAQLKSERDSLLVHSQNLEVELRRLGRQSARVRELERMLADAEARLRQVSFVSAGRWAVLQPRRALGRMYRRCRQSVPFLLLKPFPAVRRTLRRFRS